MDKLNEELNNIINNSDFEADPVIESLIEHTYTINYCEISKEAYYYIMDLIRKDLKNKNLLEIY